MNGSPRAEIPNGHVPLAFLLGRRASEYSLPSLTHSATGKGTHAGSVLSDQAHVRQREQKARDLLERVLAREVRVDVKAKVDHDTALAPPQMRVSSADRRRRASELQRVLDERGKDDADSSTSGKEKQRIEASAGNEVNLYQQRQQFARYHGYVPPEPGFVEVVGHHERIRRTQSLRQLHEEEKCKRVKQLKAKQSRVEKLRYQLQQQQSETKQKLMHAERRLRCPILSDQEDESEDGNEIGAEDLRQTKSKSCTPVNERGQQKATEEEVRIAAKKELKDRHEAVQRSRAERQSLRKLRRATHEYDKTLMAKLAGPGPSFQSTLRVEEPGSKLPLDSEASSCPSLPLDGLLAQTSDADEEFARRNEPAARLQERQHDEFVRSRTRSVQFGGGFGSKPREAHQDVTNKPVAREEHDDITTHAISTGVVKSKREILAQWKTTLSTQGHRSR